MLHLTNKKSVMMGTVSVLLTLFLLLPVVQGLYGATLGAASTLGPGTYQDTHLAGDFNGYYNVSGQAGDTLTVRLVYNGSASQFALYIRNPTGTNIAISDSGPYGDQTVSAILNVNGIYTIHIYRNPTLVNISITLTITRTSPGIPGFDLVLTSFGILTLIGILVLYKNRKLIP